MNVGATTETDYGDYFMWGSTTPNTADDCTWTNAPFNNGSDSYDSTYIKSVKDTVCPNGVLAKEYDAARAIMGGDWRIPTDDEFQELLNGTTNEWVDNYNGSGVNGWKFTSKTDTSKYIFIPASGARSDSSFIAQGFNGNVWSSSHYASRPYRAWNLDFRSADVSVSSYNRCDGFVVRGVL